jgi:hypothetical protein
VYLTTTSDTLFAFSETNVPTFDVAIYVPAAFKLFLANSK